jgi:uncharacterized membrane protein YgcG
MRPRHAAVISLLLALSVAAGAFAAQRTMASASRASAKSTRLSPVLVRRARARDRMEVSLRRALHQRPPALPRIPRFKPVHLAAAATGGTPLAATYRGPSAATAPRTIFVRPPAHVVTIHRHGGEHDDGGGDGGGGGSPGSGTIGHTVGHTTHVGGGGDD